MRIKIIHFTCSYISPLIRVTTLFFINCYIITLILIPYTANAFKFTEEICQKYGLGSNWYCESSNKESKDLSANDILSSELSPEQKAIELNNLWETQIKRATISGKKQDILEFLETHYLITNKGIDFSRRVQEIIDDSPQFFTSESYYKNVVDVQIKKTRNKEILEDASTRYGLVFIYSASCPHCLRQLPIIQQLSHLYKFKILGITSDEHIFPGLDENIVNDSIINDPLVQAYPTILLIDRNNPRKIFISKGLTTFDDLEDKIVRKIGEIQ